VNPPPPRGIVIVGGGLAAVRTAQGLRSLGCAESITIFSEESVVPYDRPPLSKDFLTGALDEGRLALLTAAAIDELGLRIHLNARAVRLDRARRRLEFANGLTQRYDKLVIATGARARRLPGLGCSPRIRYLRSVDDARALAAALATARRVVVVGSGFIGLEVASSARVLGIDAEVVAADGGPMIGVVGKVLSDWLAALHAANSVPVTSGITVTGVEETPSSVVLHTSDGAARSADLVLVGAGISRELHWLAAAGLEVRDGLVCDKQGRTADPHIFGAGDIVCVRDEFGCQPIGHWTAATDSARRAAHAIMDAAEPDAADDGFFWTEQHGHRLQFVGSATPDTEVTVTSGTLDSGKFVAELRSSGELTGVFGSNSPRDFLKSRLSFGRTVQC
jgi:3-phenylpropionate/trans-cinnamate dioxygenase ferredoxin reductase component